MIDGLKPYTATKDSGVEWLGEVPEHWEVLPGRACFFEKQEPNIGMKENTVLSLSYGRIVVKPEERLRGLVPESFETYQVVNQGDIICRPTDLQNDHTSLRFGFSNYRGIITSAYMCFSTNHRLDRRYGHLLFHSYDIKKIFYGLGSGLRQNLSWRDFKYLPCVVPTPPEQAAIVKYLDHVDRRLRRLVGAKRKLIALLTEQKQAIIHRSVTRGLNPDVSLKDSGVEWLGKVPAHWKICRLKWVTRLQRGFDLPVDRRIQGLYPVVSSGGFIGTHAEFRATAPGVVIGRYGSTDAVFYIEENYWPHNTSLFVTDFQGNTPKWCYYLLKSISKADHAGKSAVPGVDRKDLFQIFVAVPPLVEQLVIVKRIESELLELDNAATLTNREIDLLNEYRTRLIADVVTGKLDVREAAAALPEVDPLAANDEPEDTLEESVDADPEQMDAIPVEDDT